MKEGDLEKIRFSREIVFAEQLAAQLFPTGRAHSPRESPTADRVRRRLLVTHVRLSENMAPEVFDYARHAVSALGL